MVVQVATILIAAEQFRDALGVEPFGESPLKQEGLHLVLGNGVASFIEESFGQEEPVEGLARDEVFERAALAHLFRGCPQRHRFEQSLGPVLSLGKSGLKVLDGETWRI